MEDCPVCKGSGLLAVGIVDDSCPLCDGEPSSRSRVVKLDRSSKGTAVALTATSEGRKQLANGTLEILRLGYYNHEGCRVDIANRLEYAVHNTVLYPASAGLLDAQPRSRKRTSACRIEVTDETTMEAGQRLSSLLGSKNDDALCVLNFASARNPGGGFLKGALAQEECLAYASGLYGCLEQHMHDFYTPHRQNPEDGLYSHAMLYSPRVPFFRDDSGAACPVWSTGVITSPAPNAGAVKRKASKEKLAGVLEERIGRILRVALEQGHTHLVLGAFGCGVFRNDPRSVAAAFDGWLRGPRGLGNQFQHIVFAIPFDNQNYPAFAEHFGDDFSREARLPAGEADGANRTRKEGKKLRLQRNR